jgi:hypothetical protein
MPFFGQNANVTATTAQQLTTVSNPCPHGLTVQALTGNTQPVWLALSAVAATTAVTTATTQGFPLYAGQFICLSPAVVTDASSLYVVSGATTQGLAYYGC